MRTSSQKMSGTSVVLDSHSPLKDVFAILPDENELTELLQEEKEELAKQRVTELQSVFGKDQFFYGISYQKDLATDVNAWMQEQEIQAAAYQLIDSLHADEAFSVKVMHHIKEGEQIDNLQQEMQELTASNSLEDPEKRGYGMKQMRQKLWKRQKKWQKIAKQKCLCNRNYCLTTLYKKGLALDNI
ncbi:hypothetical protein GCM10025857_54120 [Alicyclobacillus contaminans]|nr:hypothetical protein GCM10025857_54120 [Alicyclobacillus contaminans]